MSTRSSYLFVNEYDVSNEKIKEIEELDTPLLREMKKKDNYAEITRKV